MEGALGWSTASVPRHCPAGRALGRCWGCKVPQRRPRGLSVDSQQSKGERGRGEGWRVRAEPDTRKPRPNPTPLFWEPPHNKARGKGDGARAGGFGRSPTPESPARTRQFDYGWFRVRVRVRAWVSACVGVCKWLVVRLLVVRIFQIRRRYYCIAFSIVRMWRSCR